MDEYLLSYREVIPDQTNSEEYKEIKLNTGKNFIEVMFYL